MKYNASAHVFVRWGCIVDMCIDGSRECIVGVSHRLLMEYLGCCTSSGHRVSSSVLALSHVVHQYILLRHNTLTNHHLASCTIPSPHHTGLRLHRRLRLRTRPPLLLQIRQERILQGRQERKSWIRRILHGLRRDHRRRVR